jgi:hypothetical protein
MNRLQAAKKVFLIINEELSKLDELNIPVVRRLKLINEELSESVTDLIKKYETCTYTTNYATQASASVKSTSVKHGERPETLSVSASQSATF